MFETFMKQNNSTTNSSLEYTDKILNNNIVNDYEILYTIDYNVDPNEINNPANILPISQNEINNPANILPIKPYDNFDFQKTNNAFAYPEYPAYQDDFVNNTSINSNPINNKPINNPESNIDSLIYAKFKPLDSLYLSKKKIKEMCQEKKLILSDVEINNIYRYFYEKKLNELDLNSYLNKLYTDDIGNKIGSKNKDDDKSENKKEDSIKKDETMAYLDKFDQTTNLDKYFGVKDKSLNNNDTSPQVLPPTKANNNNDPNFDYGRIKDIFKLTLLEEEQKKYHLDAQLEKIKKHIDKRLSQTESIFHSNARLINDHYVGHLKTSTTPIENNDKNNINSCSKSKLDFEQESNILANNEKKNLNNDSDIISSDNPLNAEGDRSQTSSSSDITLNTTKPSDLYLSKNFDELNEKQNSYTSSNSLKTNLMQTANNAHSIPNLENINSEQEFNYQSSSTLSEDETFNNANRTYDWRKDRNKTHFSLNELENSADFLSDRNNNLSSQLASEEDYIDEKLSKSLDDISLIKEITKNDIDPNLGRDLDTSIELFENVRK